MIALESKNWRFGGAPEAGLLLPVGDMYGHQHVILAAKYNFVLGDKDDNGIYDEITWWEINLGITWNPEFQSDGVEGPRPEGREKGCFAKCSRV